VSPDIKDSYYFSHAFMAIQKLIEQGLVLAGHDISSGGLITALLEMCFPSASVGLKVKTDRLKEKDLIKALFSENAGILIQIEQVEKVRAILDNYDIDYISIADVTLDSAVSLPEIGLKLDVAELRDVWFRSSYLLDRKQSGEKLAKERLNNYKNQKLSYQFGKDWTGNFKKSGIDPFRKEKAIQKLQSSGKKESMETGKWPIRYGWQVLK